MTNSPTGASKIPTKQMMCEKHGEYTATDPLRELSIMCGDKKESWTRCPVCTAEMRAERAEKDRRLQAAEDQIYRRQRLGDSRIPPRYIEATLDGYDASNGGQKAAIKMARRFCEVAGEGKSLVLAGKPGTGKTHIACAVGCEFARTGYTVRFGTVLSLIRMVKETYNRDSHRTESDVLRELTGVDLLIMDEVGAQIGSELEKTLFFEIVNERYQNRKSTILISNLTTDELSGFLGDRLIDRFREGGAILAFDWESYRGKK